MEQDSKEPKFHEALVHKQFSVLKKKNQLIVMQNCLTKPRGKFNNNFPKHLLFLATIKTAKLEIILYKHVPQRNR